MSETRFHSFTRNITNDRYRAHYDKLIYFLVFCIAAVLVLVFGVLYQVTHKPNPVFSAISAEKQVLPLHAAEEPNLSTTTLIKKATEAAVLAYTFDFTDYKKQLLLAKPYFTEVGWTDFTASLAPTLRSVVERQLIVNGVVNGPAVVSNEGPLPGFDYVWRIQIPFLVTYTTSESSTKRSFIVIVTMVKVPTWINPAGVGINQFVMKSAR